METTAATVVRAESTAESRLIPEKIPVAISLRICCRHFAGKGARATQHTRETLCRLLCKCDICGADTPVRETLTPNQIRSFCYRAECFTHSPAADSSLLVWDETPVVRMVWFPP